MFHERVEWILHGRAIPVHACTQNFQGRRASRIGPYLTCTRDRFRRANRCCLWQQALQVLRLRLIERLISTRVFFSFFSLYIRPRLLRRSTWKYMGFWQTGLGEHHVKLFVHIFTRNLSFRGEVSAVRFGLGSFKSKFQFFFCLGISSYLFIISVLRWILS